MAKIVKNVEERDPPSAAAHDSGATNDHIGRVFAVPDAWWGFEAVGRDDHPGACVQGFPLRRELILLKGTGAEKHTTYRPTEVLVAPTATNGLQKHTMFSLRPRPFRKHKIANLVPERVMGQLSEEDLHRLQSEMIRHFGSRR